MNWPSHQIAMRIQLFWYVTSEFLDSTTFDADVAQFHRKQLSLLESAKLRLLEFLRRLLNARSSVRFQPQLELEVISNAQSAIKLVEELTNWITWCLRTRRPLGGGKPVPEWKRRFVLRLAAFWYVITADTSVGSPFNEFVSAAWRSLHDDIPDVSWDHYIREYLPRGIAQESIEQEAMEMVNSAAKIVGFLWADGVSCQNPPAI
jgi:hypothetical protein